MEFLITSRAIEQTFLFESPSFVCLSAQVPAGDNINISADGFTLFHLSTGGGNVLRNAAMHQQILVGKLAYKQSRF